MRYWVTTDTHLGHTAMEEYCGRPADFSSRIITALRRSIQPGDVLIHLGDICIGNDAAWHSSIVGVTPAAKRWLIRGNHDRKSISWYLDHGWDVVADEMELEIYGRRICFSHRPIGLATEIDLNIHGHEHNTRHHLDIDLSPKHLLLFIEHEYQPFDLRKLVEGGVR